MQPLRFSLVIPAYNEAALLPRLLESVETARRAYVKGRDTIEVIVADNSSTDATARIAADHGCLVATVEKRVIGAARNGGAAIAQGEIICFVDADARVHPQTFNEIERALETGRVIGGATGVKLERWSLGLLCTFAAMVPIVVLMRMDTGVVFCLRDDFKAVQGYSETRLFAEDVEFLFKLRALGRPRRQRLARVTTAKAIASVRKFDKYGEWHYFTQIARLVGLMIRSPEGATEFVRRYWYNDRDQ
ncbi:MAG TPA: glycosyltransferase [Thermoanaerobaculia bacterium]|nr:glycosyltransferase [Thermoanaerobaculia bacterium]